MRELYSCTYSKSRRQTARKKKGFVRVFRLSASSKTDVVTDMTNSVAKHPNLTLVEKAGVHTTVRSIGARTFAVPTFPY